MHKDIKEILISKIQINKRVQELGKLISLNYQQKDLILVGLLSGCNPFIGDLIKCIDLDFEIHYMKVSSYVDTKSSGHVAILLDILRNIENKDILIIEDIIDTGHTLNKVVSLLKARNPKSIKIMTLLDKREGRIVSINVDYVGFVVKNVFVVGYGLDYNEKYRNLPYIGILKESVYAKEKVNDNK